MLASVAAHARSDFDLERVYRIITNKKMVDDPRRFELQFLNSLREFRQHFERWGFWAPYAAEKGRDNDTEFRPLSQRVHLI